jgi:hypothetical protein
VQEGGKDAITVPPGNVIETLRAAGQFGTFLDLLQVGGCIGRREGLWEGLLSGSVAGGEVGVGSRK